MKYFLVTLMAIFILMPQTIVAGDLSVASVVRQINSVRKTSTPLTINETLNSTAQAKCDDLIFNNYYAHTSPDGVTFKEILDRSTYDYEIAAENITINQETAGGAVISWMESKPHKTQMLRDLYTEIGVGISKGNLAGADVTVVCTHLAKPNTTIIENSLVLDFLKVLKIISISV